MNPDKMNELMKSPVLEQALKELVEAWEGLAWQLRLAGHEKESRDALECMENQLELWERAICRRCGQIVPWIETNGGECARCHDS